MLLPGFIATRITESARNRPPSLGETAEAASVTRTTTGIEPAMEAAEVAAMVVDAVRTGEFWILTHQAYRPVIQARAAGIGTVLWATGARPDHSWLEVPVLDRRGRVRHDGGVVDWPGLYVLGLPAMRSRRSTYIDGARADTRELTDHLVGHLAGSRHDKEAS